MTLISNGKYRVIFHITLVMIKGFFWHRTESDWYECHKFKKNKATYIRTLFSSAFMNNQY